jgi:tetratricopeptide (TPR) repeat protein
MKRLIVGILLAVSLVAPAFAEMTPLEQLGAGNYEAVERSFAKLQARFEVSLASEYELLDGYRGFYQTKDRYRTVLDNWIKAYPHSASAYLARGVYYRKLGEYVRGTDYISNVPREDIEYMQQLFRAADKDLHEALRLNPKSYLAILHLLNIAQFEGNTAAADKYLAMGSAILPSNLLVRARYIIHLMPRWGGSYPAMARFIDDSRAQGVSKTTVDLLSAIMFNDFGMVARQKGDIEGSRLAYERALILAQAGDERFRHDYVGWATRLCLERKYSDKPYCQ